MNSDYPLRVLVCGGRDYTDANRLAEVLFKINIGCIAHGAARGADSLASAYADRHKVDQFAYHADWRKHGKRAGVLRNQRMLDDFQPDLVVAFPGGVGTRDMVNRARLAGVEVLLVGAVSGASDQETPQ